MTVMDGGRRPAGSRNTASRISSRMARAWAEPSIRRAGTRRVYRGASPSPLWGWVLVGLSLPFSGRVLSSSRLFADRDADPPSPLRGGVGEGVSLYHDFSLPA